MIEQRSLLQTGKQVSDMECYLDNSATTRCFDSVAQLMKKADYDLQNLDREKVRAIVGE